LDAGRGNSVIVPLSPLVGVGVRPAGCDAGAPHPRDAQRDATWEEARKQETEHMEINEAAAEGEKISSLQNTIPYGML